MNKIWRKEFSKICSSSSHEVQVRFRSDGSSADTGFLITWAEEVGCGGLLRGPKVNLDWDGLDKFSPG